MKAFPTVHRVKSQGYVVYKQHKKLKENFMGKPNHEIAKLIKLGVAIHDITIEPELAYTGKTVISLGNLINRNENQTDCASHEHSNTRLYLPIAMISDILVVHSNTRLHFAHSND